MEELEYINSHHGNGLEISSKKTSTAEDQNVLTSKKDCLLTKSCSKTNPFIDSGKFEDGATSLEAKQIPKPGNASYFDLSKHNLKIFPAYLYEHCIYIKFLYLEGNFIKELDDNFFPSLVNMKWLDIRNNLLEGLPKNIANHSNLEVLLLQDNKLRTLPLELGLVPRLRGLQVLGNPLEFPPKEVLEKGVKSVIEMLQEEYKIHVPSPTIIRPIGDNFYKEVKTKDASPATERKYKSKAGNFGLKMKSTVKLKRTASANFPAVKSSQLQVVPRAFVSKSVCKLEDKMLSPLGNYTGEAKPFKALNKRVQKMGRNILPLWPTTSSSNYHINKMEAKIQDVLLKEQLISKIKDLMGKQLAIIQKWKDEETLKNWRRNEKFNTMERDTVGEIPFAIDPDFMKDATSATGVRKKRQEQNAVRDVQEEISKIFHSLQNLRDTHQTKEISPRTQQNLLCNEIQMLVSLQQKLQTLKLRNPCQGLPPPIASLPVRGLKLNTEKQ